MESIETNVVYIEERREEDIDVCESQGEKRRDNVKQKVALVDRWKEKQVVGPHMKGKCGERQGSEEWNG